MTNTEGNANLLADVARGDNEAMQNCIDRYGNLIWSLTGRGVFSESDREDLVQDIFINLWKSAGRFDPNIRSEVVFVTMIARRRIIDYQRKNARSNIIAEENYEPSSAVDVVESSVEISNIKNAIATLSPEEKQVLDLTIMLGLTHSEASEYIDAPLGTVKTCVRRGLNKLRDYLDQSPARASKSTKNPSP